MQKRLQRLIVALISSLIVSVLSWAQQTTSTVPTQPTVPNTAPTTQSPEITSQEQTHASPEPHAETKPLTVTRVIDGDTVVLSTGEHVRLIGIDTPELHPRDGSGIQCFAGEAAQRTVELTFQKEVHLEKDTSETDRYGRLLRFVYVGDTFVNKVLVEEGYAKARAYRPDTHRHAELEAAMVQAQNENRGMWKECPQK